jgi:diguanylate cyclase (GGDEF)-like protein
VLIDARTPLRLWVRLAAEQGSDHAVRIEELVDNFLTTLGRAEEASRLRDEANRDPLTGVGNRRVGSRALATARNLAERNGETVAVLMLDLDHFKRVNDEFGHQVGDAVLVAFTAMLAQTVRSFDTVSRWGGEEFLVVCPSCGETGAVALANRVLALTPTACSGVLPGDRRQTVSIGIALYPVTSDNPDALVRAADQALYAVKRTNRNRYQLAPPKNGS